MKPWTGGQVNPDKYFLKIYIFLIDGMSEEKPRKYIVCLLSSSKSLASKPIKVLQNPYKDEKIFFILKNIQSLVKPRRKNDDDSELHLFECGLQSEINHRSSPKDKKRFF